MYGWIIAAIAGLAWALARQKVPGRSAGTALSPNGAHTPLGCPVALVDAAVNTQQRTHAIRSPHVRYGPVHSTDTTYWDMLALQQDTTTAEAKRRRCANCAAFDRSPRIIACANTEARRLFVKGAAGYCHMHHFEVGAKQSCLTWKGGAPIMTNTASKAGQRENT